SARADRSLPRNKRPIRAPRRSHSRSTQGRRNRRQARRACSHARGARCCIRDRPGLLRPPDPPASWLAWATSLARGGSPGSPKYNAFILYLVTVLSDNLLVTVWIGGRGDHRDETRPNAR